MRQLTSGTPRVSKLRVAVIAALAAGVVGVVSLPTAQAVEGGDARCDALDVALSAELAGTPILDIVQGTPDVVAPDPENGTNSSGITGSFFVRDADSYVLINLVRCEATRAPDFLSAEAEIANATVNLFSEDVITINSIMSEVLCPAAGTGLPTASASANLTVGGEVIELDTDLGDLIGEQNVDFAIPGVLDGRLNVVAETSATADDDSAEATGLELTLTFSGALLGQSVVLTLGTITFAETSCTVGAPDSGPPPTTGPPSPEGFVFVCKFVGTPGVDEELQTGDNPIRVSANSIPDPEGDGVQVGDEFADEQGRSVVIAFDEGQPEPSVDECPTPGGGPPTTTPPGGTLPPTR